MNSNESSVTRFVPLGDNLYAAVYDDNKLYMSEDGINYNEIGNVDEIIPLLKTVHPTRPKVHGDTSDGYHTFNELYRHRGTLFIALCAFFPGMAWKSKLHDDGTMFDNMFIVGISHPTIGNMTYHLEMEHWNDCGFITELERAPEFDGHTPEDVLARIKAVGHFFGHTLKQSPLIRYENPEEANTDKPLSNMPKVKYDAYNYSNAFGRMNKDE